MRRPWGWALAAAAGALLAGPAAGQGPAKGAVKAGAMFSRLTSGYRLEFSISEQANADWPRRLARPADRFIWPILQRIRVDCLRQTKVSMLFDLTGEYRGALADRALDALAIDGFGTAELDEAASRLLTCSALALQDARYGITNPYAFRYPRVLVTGPGRRPVASNVAKWRSWLETEAALKARAGGEG